MKIGRITMSDRASQGVYEDLSGPEIEKVFRQFIQDDFTFISKLVSDDIPAIKQAMLDLADMKDCALIITTGGTGPAPRDVTPEATKEIITKELPGFGEIMRIKTYEIVKTSILSRGTAGVYKKSLIVNLPGKPSAIGECLPLLLPAISEAIYHLQGFRLNFQS